VPLLAIEDGWNADHSRSRGVIAKEARTE